MRASAASSGRITLLLLVAVVLIAQYDANLPLPSSIFVSAQTKFASRAKLDEGSKKKRKLFGGTRKEEGTLDDGEYTSWWKKRNKVVGGDNLDSSWRWELFLAESRMIIISFITSVLCAALSWIWYSRPIFKKGAGEEGGEYFCECACPLSSLIDLQIGVHIICTYFKCTSLTHTLFMNQYIIHSRRHRL